MAFLSLGPVTVNLISATLPTVKVGAQFPLAIPLPFAHRSPATIEQEELERLDGISSKEAQRSLRLLRKGFSDANPFDALMTLWGAAETIAQHHAHRDGAHVEYNCRHCGEKTKGPLKTHPYIEEFLRTILDQDGKAEDAEKIAETLRENRGKVAHGRGHQDRAFQNKVDQHLGQLKVAVAAALSELIGAPSSVRMTTHRGHAVFYLQLTATSEMQNLGAATVLLNDQFGSWGLRAPAALPRVPERFGREQQIEVSAATIPFPFPIPNICLPTVEA